MALLSQIPGLVSASFNLLESKSTIKAHNGDTNAIVRCHLGLYIPDGLPNCGFQVAQVQKSWQNGKLLLFCDAHTHRAWNNSPQKRYILLFDVILPQYLKQKRSICASVLASLFLQSWAAKLQLQPQHFDKVPRPIQYLLFIIAKYSAMLLTPIRNKLSEKLN